MKWTRAELLNLQENQIHFDEFVEFDKNTFKMNERLRDLHDIHVSGVGYFSSTSNEFEVELEITGIMECPCAITNESVDVPFDTCCHEVFSFVETDDVDVHVVKNEIIELIPVIFQLISLEVPLKVVKDGPIDYPKGNGWQIMSEEDYEKSKGSQIDPRLAKLKDFKIEND